MMGVVIQPTIIMCWYLIMIIITLGRVLLATTDLAFVVAKFSGREIFKIFGWFSYKTL